MRRAPTVGADIPVYDRNDVTAPSFVIVTARAIYRSWSSSGGERFAQNLMEELTARGEAVEHCWLNPGPNFGAVPPVADMRRAA